MFVTKIDQRKYAVLLALSEVSSEGIKREDIIRQCEASLIIPTSAGKPRNLLRG